MPAHLEEAEDAEREGVRINWLRTITAFDGPELQVEVMELDESGYPQPTGRFETLAADTVILALGQETDTAFLRQVPGVEFDRDGTVQVSSSLETGCPGVFAGGDMVPSERTVTVGVGHGKKAARHIDAWLARRDARERAEARARDLRQAASLVLRRQRRGGSSRSCRVEERIADFDEVVGGLSAEEAVYEASRCLSCGNCFECDGCLGACPEDAVIKLGVGPPLPVRLRPLHRLRGVLRAVPGARDRDGRGAPTEMRATIDGNEAAASVAYRLNEVCCIYPITPSSPMAELADEWSSQGRTNVWGTVPAVVEMQSEGGAAGALHGALQSGALATTFTASQGLLLMIPNMYKIAGELTPAVLHVAARSLAAQGLSIFGDHSDVMAVRQTGFALLASASVQEAHDLALVAQAATLATRVPFVHFFDGFRTSHELNTIELLSDDDLRALVPEELVRAHRDRALSPERPFIRGTAQNPDVYFQARETVNPFYARVPDVVEDAMARLAERTGRRYHVVDYSGHPEAERVLVVMGSGGETVRETVAALERARRAGRRRAGAPVPAVPGAGARRGAARDRAPHRRPRPDEGARLDRRAALPRHGRGADRVVRGRRARGDADGSSAAATACPRRSSRRAWSPACSTSSRAERPRRRFTIGINDDVSGTSLAYDAVARHRAARDGARDLLRPGLGRDGRREQEHDQDPRREEGLHAQGYFVYDSKKSGSQTVSHLRFGPQPIRAPYLVQQASFVGCHQFGLLDRVDVLGRAADGATLLLNCPRAAGRGVGRAVAAGAGADPRQAHRRVRDRRRPDRPRGRPRRTDEHRPADLLLRPLRACCRASRRSSGSRQRSRRRTAGAAPTWSSATRPRSTARSTACTGSRCRQQATRHARACRRSFPRTRPSSSAPSPRRCWPAAATTCRSARCRSTARIRAARRPTRSATSPSSSRSGTPTSASSAATAASSARTA